MIIIFVEKDKWIVIMNTDMGYKTKHRTKLINYLISKKDEHLTIQDIQKDLPTISQATLYRLIDSLVEEGAVRKYIIGPSSSCCFQYVSCHHHEHFHLICEKCGKLIHLECDEANHFISHLEQEHGFSVDVSKINFYGICDECAKGE